MFLRRTALCVLTALAVTAGPAAARAASGPHPDPTPDPSVPTSGGLYVAKGGVAEIRFRPEFTDKIKKLGVSIRYLKPWYPLAEDPSKGFGMPVGSDMDAFTDPNRVTYPGGIVLTDHKGNAIAFNGVWLRFVPGGFYAVPWVNGVRQKNEKHLLAFDLVQAAASLKEHGGGFGPKDLPLRITRDMAELVNSVAEAPPGSGMTKPYVKPGEQAGVINVSWRDRPNEPTT